MESFSLLLGFVLVAASPQVPPDDPEAGTTKPARMAGALPVGLEPGDTFVLELKFSDTWEAAQVSIEGTDPAGPGRGQVGRPLTPADLQRIRASARSSVTLSRRAGQEGPPRVTLGPSVRSIPRVHDPLFVDATFEGEFLPAGRLRLSPRISRVHYFDDRGRTWTLEPRKADVTKRAQSIVKDNAARWNPESSDRLEREMVEEQLLGAALAILDETPVEVALAERGEPASFTSLDRVLRDNLPREFPEPLLDRVRRFYSETLSRIITPAALRPEELRRGAAFERDGVSFEVERVLRAKDGFRVRVKGQREDDGTGRAMRQSILFDARTGMVVESESIFLRDAPVGSNWWVGSERWQTKLLSVKKAPRRPPRS